MLPEQQTLASGRTAIARASRHLRRHGDDPIAHDHLTRAKRDYAAHKITKYIREVVAAAPPLSDEQRARIAALLRSGGAVT
jgi:mono/diheme cytochrome c family protein